METNEQPAYSEGYRDTWLGGRGPRLTPYQKQRIREYCLERDGNRCMICSKEERDPLNLEIDHEDGNSVNHHTSNLRLVHHRCNSREWNRRFWNTQQVSTQSKRGIVLLAPQDDLMPISQEVRLNRMYEPLFRRFCLQKVLESKFNGPPVNKNELRVTAREYIGCSYQSSYSYVERLFAPNGPFFEKDDYCSGEKFVDFRDQTDVKLSLADLESKYPKEGRRLSNKFGGEF
jgi:hypothetical protein